MIINTIKKSIPPIHPEGFQFIVIFAIAAFFLAMVNNYLGIFGFVMTLYCMFFFRDPVRIISKGETNLVSPADGLVQKICKAVPPSESGLPAEEMTRISIFLSVFNVHVNRIPCASKVKNLHYRPGKFINASLDKASEDNERKVITLESTYKNVDIVVVQIAGLIARRIVCDLTNDQEVGKGDKFGIIRFGSRVDVYVPLDTKITVEEGQTLIGGETIIADLV
jgi:phosphatidylserine decarboxylase